MHLQLFVWGIFILIYLINQMKYFILKIIRQKYRGKKSKCRARKLNIKATKNLSKFSTKEQYKKYDIYNIR